MSPVLVASLAILGALPGRERTLFDGDWRFAFGNAADVAQDFGFGSGYGFLKAGDGEGALSPSFDDSAWRTVDLPHDWAVEVPFDGENKGFLHVAHGCREVGADYPATSIGWYRKRFSIAKEDVGRRLSLEFDGVFRDCQVWLNGHYLGRNLSGYAPFRLDFTDYANYGGENVLAVRVDATHGEGWFYEGAGIYRHTWLVKTHPVHVPQWGIHVMPSVQGNTGTIKMGVEIRNDGPATDNADVKAKIIDEGSGEEVAAISVAGMKLDPWANTSLTPTIKIARPKLWSLEARHLYRCEVEIRVGGKLVDSSSTRFGFRTVTFDKDKGFFLNGKPIKIRGACNHQDHAGVGSALTDGLQEFRIARLKEFGFNAYRTSHNPPTPELLDACDRLGMLVLDENRLLSSSEEGISQLERLVRRDRNHPSVIAWSISNEEPEQNTDRGGRIAATMIRSIRALDPTRLITAASNAGNAEAGLHPLIDLRGFNYKNIANIDEYRKKHPNQILWGTEEASTVTTRGEYAADPKRGYLSAYDLNKPGWGALAEDWQTFYANREWLAGAFVWTGFDYRGEPTPYQWPCISSHFGVLDTCGFPKDVAFYYQAWWTDQPVLHLLPHWNWAGKEGKPIDVWCFSNHDEVELFLNGVSQGRKEMPRNGHLEWKVNYAPGELKAVGYRKGNAVQTELVQTTGAPAKLAAKATRHGDTVVVDVSAHDVDGRVVPTANLPITFAAVGGELLGVGNGDPSCHEADRFFAQPSRLAIEGWKMKEIDSISNVPAGDEGFKKVSLGQANQVRPNHAAVFRASFSLDNVPDRARLAVGRIDDHGTIMLNGVVVGEVKQWDEPFSADVSKILKPGANTIQIVMENGAGEGGVANIAISSPGVAPVWTRSLFNGLAQAIVKAPSKGKVTVTVSAPGVASATAVVGG